MALTASLRIRFGDTDVHITDCSVQIPPVGRRDGASVRTHVCNGCVL